MVQGMNIKLPANKNTRGRPSNASSVSPSKKGRSQSGKSGRSPSGSPSGRKRGFPTTPRSIEKQKKQLAYKLKKAMDDNLRLNAHNRTLKDKNQTYLDAFSQKDQERTKNIALNSNARRQLNFKVLVFHKIKENLLGLDGREQFQEKNLKGLVKFAKGLTVELKDYQQKVVMAEQIISDLKKAGSDDMGSLIDMLNAYKLKEANVKEEIEKLSQLSLIKDDELQNLDIELKSLDDFLENVRQNQMDKITTYKDEISENQKVIRRQDKLIVDLMQRNELSQNAVQITQDALARKENQQDNLKMKMQELTDQRSFFNESISQLQGKIIHTESMQAQQRAKMQEQRAREREAQLARQAAEEAEAPARNRRARRYRDTGSNAGDKQSQKSGKSFASGSRMSGSPMKSSLKYR